MLADKKQRTDFKKVHVTYFNTERMPLGAAVEVECRAHVGKK